MRLLIVAQTVDRDDPVLGFFHVWIARLAEDFERVEVICLKEGKHEFPANVRVHSLGKEQGTKSRVAYARSFLSLVWKLRYDYDAVFVHMNQEYLLIAGWLWALLRKPAYLWRNHHDGSWLTDVAALFCKKVFCTSRFSYTAKYTKTVFMPVGVDTEYFKPDDAVTRDSNRILALGRLARSKRMDVLLEALALLPEARADIVGSPLAKDEVYVHGLRNLAQALDLGGRVFFSPGVRQEEAVVLYQQHGIFVNCSSSGMYDKTIFEAMASGCLVLASNKNLEGEVDDAYVFPEGDSGTLAKKLSFLLSLPEEERASRSAVLRAYASSHHSLQALMEKLALELQP
jgi:glycosyltransferase involved in cell wall biosynthesis